MAQLPEQTIDHIQNRRRDAAGQRIPGNPMDHVIPRQHRLETLVPEATPAMV